MEWKRGPMLLLGGTCCFLVLGAGSWTAPSEKKATRVTLALRSDSGPYEKSAYSFRFASQDAEEHHNEVDLVFSNCGNLHISDGGATNRVAVVPVKKLSQVEESPEDGWLTSCFSPVKSAVYVMQIEDGHQKFRVKFRIVDVRQDKIVLEWLPFAELPESERGTLGQCGGPHACS